MKKHAELEKRYILTQIKDSMGVNYTMVLFTPLDSTALFYEHRKVVRCLCG